MKRKIFFIICILIPLIFYAEKRETDIYASLEKTIIDKTETDITYCLMLQARDVTNTKVQLSQIIDALEDGDVILDFFTFLDSLDCPTYWVFVVKKGMKAPLLYKLFKERELSSLIDKDKNFYNDKRVLKLILKSLKNELKGVNTIYYTPSGILYEIALEYCIDENGRLFCENYDVYRMTSSSMICNRRHRRDYVHYSVWGGIDIEDQQVECQEDTCLNTYDTRLFYYLEDSYKAAKIIVEELKENRNKIVDFYNNETATEINFKSMSGKDIDVFLIETHGIFTRDCSISPHSFGAPIDNHALALCGASSVMDTGIVPQGYEDGLITEEEIAKLDFSGMDLAVISACKSGLGTIKWDGMHGLMRGLKIAGVNSIVMTLDNVVDYVSGQLWISFFRNLSNGQSKRMALLNSIQYIKSLNHGVYSHPKFWTPFILIDGIE